VIGRSELPGGERPLEKAVWGGAVDNVGGAMLANLTRTVRPWGNIASIGLAGGVDLDTTVMPFILRGVSLLGIDSVNCPHALRNELWQRLATDMRPKHLEDIVEQTVDLAALPQVFKRMLGGETRGRTVVRIAKFG
jgi:acrylyl-CoA reductase (NADPH)